MEGTKDSNIRSVLYATELARHAACSGSLVVPELEICQREFRIDVAVVTGTALHGYEIKSDRDTLSRLPAQAVAYGRVFDFVTLVAGASHVEPAWAIVPGWWRILEAGGRGAEPVLRVVRDGTRNPAPDPLALAQLLWREELVAMLEECGASKRLLRRPKWDLWPALAECLPAADLGARVRGALRQRQSWRRRPS
jgi:hypothetical protein